MEETRLKNALKEILLLGFKGDDGERIEFIEDMDFEKVIKEIIPQLVKTDFFTKTTTEVLAEFGWTKETAKGITFTPEPVVEDTLLQSVDNCIKHKELKEIALSEPEFKSIRGKLASYDFDSLKQEMLWILKGKDGKETETPFKEVADKFEAEKKDNQDDFGKNGSMPIASITIRAPFNSLFSVDPETLKSITENIKQNGYDNAFPVILWKDTLIDGHTRLLAAKDAGMKAIPYFEQEFADEHEALEYAMHNQRDRRNITEAELLKCISVIDTPMSKTEAGAVRGEKSVPSHKKTAETLGIGQSKVTDARTVLKDETATKEVKEGKKTIRDAAKQIRESKRKPKASVSAPSTLVECIMSVLKDNAGKDIEMVFLLEEAGNIWTSTEGNDASLVEDTAVTVLEVLFILKLVKLEGSGISIKKGIK